MPKLTFFQRFKISSKWMLILLMGMLVLEVLNHFTNYALSLLGGIIPRDPYRLPAVVSAPFLHFSPQHFLINSVPFAVLGGFICLECRRIFVKLTFFSAVFAGLAVWLLGRTGSVHAGSSLLIFAYFGFLLASGWYAKTWKSLLLAALIFFLYGGLLLGMLPQGGFVSWESHLFGFLAGACFAKILGSRKS